MRTDMLGREVKVGDSVICVEPDWRNLVKAKVVKITGRSITVGYISRTHYSRPFYNEGPVQECVIIDEDIDPTLDE